MANAARDLVVPGSGTYPATHLRNHTPRQGVRVPIEREVCVIDAHGRLTPAQTKDIGLGGMSLITDAALEYGDAIDIVLDVGAVRSRPREILLPAIVRWCDGACVGVQFGLIGPRETGALIELVRRSGGRY